MDLSDIDSRTPIGRLLRLPLCLVPSRAVMPILRGPLVGRRWIAGSGNHGYWIGSYEHENQRRFAASARGARVVFDVGAHVGFYTLLASTCAGPDSRVFAFEPAPRNLSYLNRHLRLNGVNNVTVLPCAVSRRGGTASFHESHNSSMGHLSDDDGAVLVKCVALDELYREGGIPAPDLIKIDVEGAEALVLAGAEELIALAGPTIFLSTHSDDLHRGCSSWLKERGYRVVSPAADQIVADRP